MFFVQSLDHMVSYALIYFSRCSGETNATVMFDNYGLRIKVSSYGSGLSRENTSEARFRYGLGTPYATKLTLRRCLAFVK